jgi:hypothetical protein
MTPDRWQKVQEVFALATEREAGSREAFLEEACQDDPELRKEVESLLSSFGAVPPLSPTERAGSRPLGKETHLRPYEIRLRRAPEGWGRSTGQAIRGWAGRRPKRSSKG